MFQNEELSNILKEIFGDEEEVDEREQEENDMFDDEGDNDNADARGFCLWNEAQYVLCFVSKMKKNRYSSLILRFSV